MIIPDPAAIGQPCGICLKRALANGSTEKEARVIAIIGDDESGVPDEEAPDGAYRHVDCFH